MKNKHTKTPLVNEYLQSLDGMQPAETPAFFYTRLKAKMEKQIMQNNAVIRLRIFAVCAIATFLIINAAILLHPVQRANNRQQIVTTAQQRFVYTYSVGGTPTY